jgi:hypothetical protein
MRSRVAVPLAGTLVAGVLAAPRPYHGYFYRGLIAQGPHAPGGARSYLKDGKLTGGFALLAYPAEHGSSGVMTYPDESWTPVRD